MIKNEFLPLTEFRKLPETEMQKRASDFLSQMRGRRTVREFSDQPVDRKIIEDCLRTAATAPSGANQQPWRFVVVSDANVKQQIRESAERIEKNFYSKEATKKWRDTLKHLKTGPKKLFLEIAPYLIVIFSQSYSYSAEKEKKKHYYVRESVGIATGMLITALHHAGLATLTYTPANMKFLNKILTRPTNEKPFMILVVGYPSASALVPALQKKALEEIAVFI